MITKKTYRLRNTECSTLAEGAVTPLRFEFGVSCGVQKTPSIRIRGAGQSEGVLTHAKIKELAAYFTYWAKIMDDPSVLGEGYEWVGQTWQESRDYHRK